MSWSSHRRPLAAADEADDRTIDASEGALSVGQALRSPQFIIRVLTNFFCCATHSGPIIHTVSYAVTCGTGAVINAGALFSTGQTSCGPKKRRRPLQS